MIDTVYVSDEMPLRDRLVATGVELLEEASEELTLRAIARCAGVSHGAPRRYFPTHNSLLAAIASVGVDDLNSLLRPILAISAEPIRTLVDIGIAYVEFARSRPEMFDLMFRHDLLGGAGGALRLTTIPLFESLNALTRSPELSLRIWTNVHGIAVLSARGSLQLIAPSTDLDKFVADTITAHLREATT